MCGVNRILFGNLFVYCVEYFSRIDVINNEPFNYHTNGHVPTFITKLRQVVDER